MWIIFFQFSEDQVKVSLLQELKAKDEIIYNIGVKYLKMKSIKIFFQKKFEKLQVHNKKVPAAVLFFIIFIHISITCAAERFIETQWYYHCWNWNPLDVVTEGESTWSSQNAIFYSS